MFGSQRATVITVRVPFLYIALLSLLDYLFPLPDIFRDCGGNREDFISEDLP